VASFADTETILNIGAGGTSYGPNVVNLEIEASAGIDIVGVAESLPIRSESCDGVILMAVLEHVQDAWKALGESKRVLVEGGRLLVDVPFIQGYHASPGDYRRFTEQGLRAELERLGFEVDGSGVALGPGSAMAWITAEFLALLVSGRSAFGYRVARNVTNILAAPIKYTDAWLEGHPMAAQIPGGVWAIARRPRA
jgi:SAM-dependent methyltransferase